MGQCLSRKTLIVFGDSTLRGPMLRMLKPVVSQLQIDLFAGHSFNKIVDDDGPIVFFDYIPKTYLKPFERRDEADMKSVFTHMVDNYAHKNIWSMPKRKVTIIIGGTDSRTYLKEFQEWVNDCQKFSSRGCPLKNIDYDVIMKGTSLTRGWVSRASGADDRLQDYYRLRA